MITIQHQMGYDSLPYPTNNFQINKYDNSRTNYESLDILYYLKLIIIFFSLSYKNKEKIIVMIEPIDIASANALLNS